MNTSLYIFVLSWKTLSCCEKYENVKFLSILTLKPEWVQPCLFSNTNSYICQLKFLWKEKCEFLPVFKLQFFYANSYLGIYCIFEKFTQSKQRSTGPVIFFLHLKFCMIWKLLFSKWPLKASTFFTVQCHLREKTSGAIWGRGLEGPYEGEDQWGHMMERTSGAIWGRGLVGPYEGED